MENPDYIKLNKANWNSRVPVHLNSNFYDVNEFLSSGNSLNDIELGLLGNIEGKTILHLQCHFGMDSISLARLGAKVTGVDFSENAIKAARDLAMKMEADAEFICCDVYSLPELLDRPFDIVFTSYGVVGWLPDLDKWAYIISKYLNPGGCFVMVEFHPVIWMFDNDFTGIAYHYLKSDPIVETDENTYADAEATLEHETSVTWNHGLGEVINSLIHYGLQLQSLDEYNYSPYNCFAHAQETMPGRFTIKHLGDKIPMVYSIRAEKISNDRKSNSRGV